MRTGSLCLGFIGLVVMTGCQSSPPVPPKVAVAPVVDAWQLGTRDPVAEEPALLWNGLIGVRVGRNGLGNNLPAFVIDNYSPTGEEKIQASPNPLSGTWSAQGVEIDPKKGTEYEQILDMRDGILRTQWKQDLGGHLVQIKSETAMHPGRRAVGQRWTFVSDGPMTLQFKSDDSEVQLPLESGKARSWERRVAFGEDPLNRTAPTPKFPQIEQASKAVWSKRWKTDIEIDGPLEDQQAVRSFMFYLQSAIHPGGKKSISPFALSDQQYNGHVFWDADIWVFPALAFIRPDAAAEIARYRLAMVPQAKRNEPTGGLRFPWESSVTGKETAPGMSREELHITGSALFALKQARALDLISPSEYRANGDLIKLGAQMYLGRAVKTARGLELQKVMSPDESHIGDNDLYTNLLAQWLADGGKFNMSAKGDRFALPKDGQSFLTYDEDRLRGYKQAAAVLSIYPLQYPPAESQAKVMMERFESKVIQNGPAMTDAVHAVIHARTGDTEKAYVAWKKAWEPFTRHPLMLFSEKRRANKTYFTTGSGGALQSVLFGFLGFRIDWAMGPQAKQTQNTYGYVFPLAEGAQLRIRPSLPKAWKKVTFRNFWLNGKQMVLTATPTSVALAPSIP